MPALAKTIGLKLPLCVHVLRHSDMFVFEGVRRRSFLFVGVIVAVLSIVVCGAAVLHSFGQTT